LTRPSERRSSPRVRVARPLRAHLALEADVLHLSTCGMAVRLPFAPALGSHQGFSLVVGGRSLDVGGLVRNVAPRDEEGDTFEVGIEFEDLTHAQEEMLEQFVAEKLKKP
jgi:PilZ domain